jgi:hypothetical protein
MAQVIEHLPNTTRGSELKPKYHNKKKREKLEKAVIKKKINCNYFFHFFMFNRLSSFMMYLVYFEFFINVT